jgi:hypothetical protein
MKGIPEKSIDHLCRKEQQNQYELYKDLLLGKDKTFDLLCKEEGISTTCKFKKNSDKSITTLQLFERKVKF